VGGGILLKLQGKGFCGKMLF